MINKDREFFNIKVEMNLYYIPLKKSATYNVT